jgi:hypothetical protein
VEDERYIIDFIIKKLKEGLMQEKDILEEINNKNNAIYEVEIGDYKGKIQILKKIR